MRVAGGVGVRGRCKCMYESRKKRARKNAKKKRKNARPLILISIVKRKKCMQCLALANTTRGLSIYIYGCGAEERGTVWRYTYAFMI